MNECNENYFVSDVKLFLTFHFLIVIVICSGRRNDFCYASVNQSMMAISIERMNILNSEHHLSVRLPCKILKGAFTEREMIVEEKTVTDRIWGLPHVWLSASTILSDKACFNFKYIFYRSQQRNNNMLISIFI